MNSCFCFVLEFSYRESRYCNSLPEEETALPEVSISFSAQQAALPLPPPQPRKDRGAQPGFGFGSGLVEGAPKEVGIPRHLAKRGVLGPSGAGRGPRLGACGRAAAGGGRGRGRTPSQVATWSAPPLVAPPRPVLRPHPVLPAHSRPRPRPQPGAAALFA